MEALTPAQERTLRGLIGTGPEDEADPRLGSTVRPAMEQRLSAAGVEDGGDPIWLGKRRLDELDLCQGLFDANLRREGGPFEHSPWTAAGTLFHAGLEVDIATERRFDARSVAERAALQRCRGDAAFGRHWSGLDPFDQAELLVQAAGRLALFRDSFPPLPRGWDPHAEHTIRARLLRGAVVLSGSPDLVLGRRRRLVIDFKSGRARPELAEDMRFYALLVLLRTGVAPYRVATFFLDSGEWQAEEVDERTLDRAVDRVVRAGEAAVRARAGDPVPLSPGRHCAWCPRAIGCPVSAAGREGTGGAATGLPARGIATGR
jgi:hypothetical protein